MLYVRDGKGLLINPLAAAECGIGKDSGFASGLSGKCCDELAVPSTTDRWQHRVMCLNLFNTFGFKRKTRLGLGFQYLNIFGTVKSPKARNIFKK